MSKVETKKSKNHADLPKTTPVECKGYVDAEGKTQLADGHTEIRLVHAQDRKQCTKCEACQKAFGKVRQAQSRGDRSLRESLKKAVAKKAEAEKVQVQYKGRLDKAQDAELQKAIDLGTKAEAQLAKA